jgi:uncharacterized protein YecT (DUF1311 family)
MNTLLPLLLALLVAAPANADGAASQGATQAGMAKESAHRARAADAELEQILQALNTQARGNSHATAKLARSQSAWEAYRDAQLELTWPSSDPQRYGSVYPMCVADLRASLTQRRSEELRALLTRAEGDVCAPGWPE